MTLRLLALLLVATTARAAPSPDAPPADGTAFAAGQVQRVLTHDTLNVTLPGGRVAAFTLTQTTLPSGARLVRGVSTLGERALFTRTAAGLHGDLYTAQGHLRLVLQGGQYAWVRHEDDPRLLRLGRDLNVGVDDIVRTPRAALPQAAPAPRAQPAADGRYEVDLLVVYTPRFEESLGGRPGAAMEIDRLVAVANGYFENSGVPVRYRVLRAEKYTGTQESAGGKRNRSILGSDPAIQAYRNRIGADLVLYLRTGDGRADLAISSLFNGEDRNDPPQDVQPDRDAFVVSYGGISRDGRTVEDFLTAHELAHTFGAGHNYSAHGLDNLYWKPYAHGKDCGSFTPGGRQLSVMSYGELASGEISGVPGASGLPTNAIAPVFEVRGDFFSSPGILRDGSACGSEGSTEAEQADNVRAISEAAAYVAAYRTPRVTPRF